MDRRTLLESSWTHVSKLYSRELAPRFLPWVRRCIQELTSRKLPEGNIIVPCCGSGQELILLHEALPGKRNVIGVDLAPGMVQVAQQLIGEAGCGAHVSARVGDASTLHQDQSLQPVAAVMSLFGLQQLQPAPGQVLADWMAMLQPGGVTAVCYWPGSAESSGPWLSYAEALEDELGRASPHSGADWEAAVPGAALQQGAELLLDERVPHSMTWPDMYHLWQVMTEGGPWHARKLQAGEDFMQRVKARWLARHPAEQHGSELVHRPSARLVVLRKAAEAAAPARSSL